jgi:hypothetical protein
MQSKAGEKQEEYRSTRDKWLSILATKYEEIDFADVYEVLKEFMAASVPRTSQHGNNEVHRPWNFITVRKLADLATDDINEINAVIAYELNPNKQMILPEIGKLSLESNLPAQREFGRRQSIFDDADDPKNIFPTADHNRSFE